MGVEGDLCLRNIDPAGVRFRRIVGLTALAVAVGLAGYLLWPGSHLPRVARLLVFLPFLLAALTLIQAREKT